MDLHTAEVMMPSANDPERFSFWVIYSLTIHLSIHSFPVITRTNLWITEELQSRSFNISDDEVCLLQLATLMDRRPLEKLQLLKLRDTREVMLLFLQIITLQK